MRFRCSLAVMFLLPWTAVAEPTIRPEPTLLPPVGSGCISSPFGPRVLPDHPLAGTYHYGIDLPAPAGASVLATAPGPCVSSLATAVEVVGAPWPLRSQTGDPLCFAAPATRQ